MSDGDAQWYKDAIIYQLHVRSFFDSVDDGIGDFVGLTQKLDYLQELGVNALWLLPFYPSPLKDDGYDIANYVEVNTSYGTLRDFKRFLHAAHERGMRVITELVLNHTSDQHPWFQRSRRAAPGSAARDFYVWSDDPNKYSGARIIFKDFESSNWAWDPVAKSYYWHRFYSHQPDLNFENPAVREALFDVFDYWLKMGVDGLRLDAVPYLYEREGTNCENLPETHEFLKELRKRVDEYPNRMLLAEANQWPEDAIAYFGDGEGDECHAAFHFPVMPRLFMATHMEDRFPVVDILEQTPTIPATCQWFIFLRNHDELTLEMVTDEERDYMYRVYAHDPQARINLGIRRRLAPLLGNNRRKIELMNGLLFSLPGTPIIYYGDEIGMGDNIYLGDRNGVRTPMQWSSDRNAGFSRAKPQQLFFPVSIDPEYHYETVNVENQRRNPQSLWWWMKRLIALRQNYLAFSRGSLELLAPENQKILAFIRRHDEECVLVVANLSRFVQYVELDLSAYEGRRPRELFGQTKFPAIGKLPYLLTLGPHAFYWFSLEHTVASVAATEVAGPPLVRVTEDLDEAFFGHGKGRLEQALASWIPTRPWLIGPPRSIQAARIVDVVVMHLAKERSDIYWAIVHVEHTEGDAEDYVIPLALATGADADRVAHEVSPGPLARVRSRQSGDLGVLYEAARDPGFGERVLSDVLKRRRWPGAQGEIVTSTSSKLAELTADRDGASSAVPSRRDRDRSFILGDKAIFRVYRRLGPGENPDIEVCRFLTEEVDFAQAPRVLGSVVYQAEGSGPPMTLGVLQTYSPGATSGWQYTLDSLSRYFELVLALAPQARPSMPALPRESPWELAQGAPPAAAAELMSGYLDAANLLGQCTGKMHAALASRPEIPAFAPEPATQFYGRSVYQSLRKLIARSLQSLKVKWRELPENAHPGAQELLKLHKPLVEWAHSLATRKKSALRIRCHGHYQLGEVAYTGKEFTIVDFGGDSDRVFTEQRIKRVSVVDVASMLRSMHHATAHAYQRMGAAGLISIDNQPSLREAARFWYVWAGSAFLRGYSSAVAPASILPTDIGELESLLQIRLLEMALDELSHVLARRPEIAQFVIEGILDLAQRR